MKLIDIENATLSWSVEDAAAYGNDFGGGVLYALDKLTDEAPTIEAPRWIPVTERLPEADINVLAITASGHFKVAGCNFSETDVYWRTNDGLGNNSITHWMPLPTPPKDGDSE